MNHAPALHPRPPYPLVHQPPDRHALILGGTAYMDFWAIVWPATLIAPCKVALTLAAQPSRGSSPPIPAEVEAIFRRFFGFSPWDRYVERRHPWGDRDPQDVLLRAPKSAAEPQRRAARRRGLADL